MLALPRWLVVVVAAFVGAAVLAALVTVIGMLAGGPADRRLGEPVVLSPGATAPATDGDPTPPQDPSAPVDPGPGAEQPAPEQVPQPPAVQPPGPAPAPAPAPAPVQDDDDDDDDSDDDDDDDG